MSPSDQLSGCFINIPAGTSNVSTTLSCEICPLQRTTCAPWKTLMKSFLQDAIIKGSQTLDVRVILILISDFKMLIVYLIATCGLLNLIKAQLDHDSAPQHNKAPAAELAEALGRASSAPLLVLPSTRPLTATKEPTPVKQLEPIYDDSDEYSTVNSLLPRSTPPPPAPPTEERGLIFEIETVVNGPPVTYMIDPPVTSHLDHTQQMTFPSVLYVRPGDGWELGCSVRAGDEGGIYNVNVSN